ncbi:MAG TPA: hypothetical protein VFZ80_02270 [Acidimicrobiia bacterium]
MRSVMYVYYFVHLGGEPQMWAYRLQADGAWLRRMAEEALLGVDGRPREGDLLEIGDSRPIGRGFSIPIAWTAPGLFVGLVGDVSLQPLETGITQMAIRGSYRSDHDGVDGTGDNHRKVETVVKRLLDSVWLGS